MTQTFFLCDMHFTELDVVRKDKDEHRKFRYAYSRYPHRLATCETVTGFKQDKDTGFNPRNQVCGAEARWILVITFD